MATPLLVVTYRGEQIPLRTVCANRGLAFTTVWARIKKGWNVDEAVDTPLSRKGESHLNGGGYVRLNGSRLIEHISIAEKALGRQLPPGAEVHHVNGNKADNRSLNLVVCPDRAYHALLHSRARAISECGNPNFRRCEICGQWGDPSEMYKRKKRSGQWHRKCGNKTRLERKQRSKA